MPTKLPPNFRETAVERYEEARKFWRNWRGEAHKAYAFISGEQWLQEDEAILKAQNRPSITFNYSEKMIDAVVGAEVSGRQEVTYAPRSLDDSPGSELLSNAAKWVADESNFEDEETDAFRDALICGMGWTHMRISYDTDADGMVVKDRIDPFEMYADPSAIKMGLADRRYSFRNLWINESDYKRQWPGRMLLGSNPEDANTGFDVVRQGDGYNDVNDSDPDNHKGQVQIRHYECVEMLPYYRVFGTEGPQDMQVSEFNSIRSELEAANIQFVRLHKRTYYYAYFNGDTLLEADLSPTQEGFTYGCITGKRDRNKNYWYGLTRVMMDPQRWANKWLSQILHIINSNAKGGLLAEINAFVDEKKAQDEWAQPNSVTLLKEGGIAKVKEKQVANYPTGLDRLMEFALASLPQVTGINLEALGLAGREQANVLEQSRKQAAYGLLAPVFNSLRNYRKQQGKVLADFIINYISDGRMVRIGGADSQQFVQLLKVPDFVRYDTIIDQSPTAPDVKRETWQVLETLIPAAMKAGMPIPPTILKYAPIPTALATEWAQYTQQSQVSPEQVKKLEGEIQKSQEENQKLKQQVADKTQEHQLKAQMAQADHQLKIAEMQQDFQLRMKELAAEIQMKLAEMQAELKLQREIAEAKASNEAKVADATAKAAIITAEKTPSNSPKDD
jgi:hypothetical protein